MPNPYIPLDYCGEQNLIADLIDEAITIHAFPVYYLPRTLVSPDELFGEDRLSRFQHGYQIDGYLESNGFEGDYVLNKWGNTLALSLTVTFSRREWERAVGRYGTSIIPERPFEGDLIYDKVSDMLFEIKFVDDKAPFQQLERFYCFKCTIEPFQYNNEKIDISNDPIAPEINFFESLKTFDQDTSDTVWGGVTNIEIVKSGRGYTSPPFIYVESLTGHYFDCCTRINERGELTAVIIKNNGENYHQDDVAHVIGNCKEEAQVKISINAIIENAGDRWGANQALVQNAQENTEDFNPEDPFKQTTV